MTPGHTPIHAGASTSIRALPGLVMVMLILSASACGLVDSDGDGWRSDLQDARARWNSAGLIDYHYTMRQLCFCGYGGAPIQVVVRDGQVVSGTLLETGEVIDQGQWQYAVLSIDDLFERIEGILENDPHEFSATYDAQLGHPISVSTDPIENAVDEEWGVETSGLEAIP